MHEKWTKEKQTKKIDLYTQFGVKSTVGKCGMHISLCIYKEHIATDSSDMRSRQNTTLYSVQWTTYLYSPHAILFNFYVN